MVSEGLASVRIEEREGARILFRARPSRLLYTIRALCSIPSARSSEYFDDFSILVLGFGDTAGEAEVELLGKLGCM